MKANICIQTKNERKVMKFTPKGMIRKFAHFASGGLFSDVYVLEKFNLSDLLIQLRDAFLEFGITDIYSLAKDFDTYYLDLDNNPYDLREVIDRFLAEQVLPGQTVFESVKMVMDCTANGLSYHLDVLIRAMHKKSEHPIQISIHCPVEKKDDRYIEQKFNSFVMKLNIILRKRVNIKNLTVNYAQKETKTFYGDSGFTNEDFTSKAAKKIHKSNPLFPVYKVTLGVTTVKELDKLGKPSREKNIDGNFFKFYQIHDLKFWYTNNVADSIYITNKDVIPVKWKKAGFSWDNSFDKTLKLLETLDCEIEILKNPVVTIFKGHNSFEAEVIGILRTGLLTYEIHLVFRSGSGSKTSSSGTFYSIRIKSI